MESGASDARIGETIADKYRLVAKLGEGGMGAVYEAVHAVTGRHVAVKLLNPSTAWSETTVERFLREARVSATIRHRNIVEVLDAGTLADGAPYIVLTLLQGEPLSAILKRSGPLPYREALSIAAEVLEALAAAHREGVIHRDIKPENVFVSTDDRGERAITLLDFGISKLTNDRPDAVALTRTGGVLGTADYMSPEQVRGDDDVDARTDVWAAGVMLYRMISSRLPFGGKNYNTVVLNVINESVPSLASIVDGVPIRLSEVVEHAMRKDRRERIASAGEFLQRVRALLDSPDDGLEKSHVGKAVEPLPVDVMSSPTNAPAPSAHEVGELARPDTLEAQEKTTRDRPSATRSPRLVIAAVAVLAMVIAGGAYAWRSASRASARSPNVPHAAVQTSIAATTRPVEPAPPARPVEMPTATHVEPATATVALNPPPIQPPTRVRRAPTAPTHAAPPRTAPSAPTAPATSPPTDRPTHPTTDFYGT
jgi:serine/threonine-protein kinase